MTQKLTKHEEDTLDKILASVTQDEMDYVNLCAKDTSASAQSLPDAGKEDLIDSWRDNMEQAKQTMLVMALGAPVDIGANTECGVLIKANAIKYLWWLKTIELLEK